jgi:hypothetical protein
MRVFRFALLAGVASLLCAAPVRDPGLSKAQATLGRLPLRFEANVGQWIPTVRYAARASGYSLLLTTAGPTIALGGSQRVDISLLGSSPASEIQPLEKLDVHTNYFVGPKDRWRSDVPTYSRVLYRQVYPGIDVVYYGGQDHLEYDFTIAPGADPSAIRLRFQGADRVSITPEGDLLVEAAGRRIVQKLPLLYQGAAPGAARREVPGRYVMLADDLIGFSVGRYDSSKPLVIDPYLIYSTYLGGSGTDQFNAAKMDSHGYYYMVGSTSTRWPPPAPGGPSTQARRAPPMCSSSCWIPPRPIPCRSAISPTSGEPRTISPTPSMWIRSTTSTSPGPPNPWIIRFTVMPCRPLPSALSLPGRRS